MPEPIRLSGQYFWAKDPKPGDSLYIVFDTAEKLDRVVVETGHPDHPNDFLRNGSLEASPKLLRIDNEKVMCADWRVIAYSADRGGAIDAKNLTQVLGGRRTKCLKISIAQYQSQWIVFNQIAVFTVKDPEVVAPGPGNGS